MQTRRHDETSSGAECAQPRTSTATRAEGENALFESLIARARRLLERGAGVASGGRQPHAIARVQVLLGTVLLHEVRPLHGATTADAGLPALPPAWARLENCTWRLPPCF